MLLRFCFTSVISLNDLNDLRIIEARGLKIPAEYWLAGNTRFAYIPLFKSSIDFSC